MRYEIAPDAPSKWRFRRISVGRVGISLNLPPSPQNRPVGGSANRGDFSGFYEDSTQSPTDPGGAKFRPFAPSKWQFR